MILVFTSCSFIYDPIIEIKNNSTTHFDSIDVQTCKFKKVYVSLKPGETKIIGLNNYEGCKDVGIYLGLYRKDSLVKKLSFYFNDLGVAPRFAKFVINSSLQLSLEDVSY